MYVRMYAFMFCRNIFACMYERYYIKCMHSIQKWCLHTYVSLYLETAWTTKSAGGICMNFEVVFAYTCIYAFSNGLVYYAI